MKRIEVELKGKEIVTLTKKQSKEVFEGKAKIFVKTLPSPHKGIIKIITGSDNLRENNYEE